MHRDPSVIKAVALHLRAAGIVVLEAPSATTAVERAMDSLTPVRLVLIEEHLPEADAAQVVERLREHAPALRVIPLREAPGAGLARPFGPAALLAAVRDALDTPPDSSGPG
ncbi:MAG: response regulator [Kiritimatiellia bacterium]